MKLSTLQKLRWNKTIVDISHRTNSFDYTLSMERNNEKVLSKAILK